jgi:hypothetical protein
LFEKSITFTLALSLLSGVACNDGGAGQSVSAAGDDDASSDGTSDGDTPAGDGDSDTASDGAQASGGHTGHDAHGSASAPNDAAAGGDDASSNAPEDGSGALPSDGGAAPGDAEPGAAGGTSGSGGGGGTMAGGGGTMAGGGGTMAGGGGTMAGGGGTGDLGGSGGSDVVSSGGSDAMGSGGDDAMPPASGGSSGMDGSGGTGLVDEMPEHDHCMHGEFADLRDADLTTPSAPDHFTASNGDVDLPLPEAVLDWMDERAWKPTHDAWHNIRRCRGGSTGGGEGSSSSSDAMCAHEELIPEHQECADADNGYEFLVMHRHMIIALKQAFPAHADLFDGFPHFPFAKEDVPLEWQSRFGSGWTEDMANVASTLEDIENQLDQFPTEGDLGKFIQCGLKSSGAGSLHGAMHFKWVVNESPNSLGKQSVNIGNYMFWRLHGWIDGIWERYRVAKGLAHDQPELEEALLDQCREMHELGQVIDPALVEDPSDPLPEEHGYFHETVRPALERLCSGCHSETSPEARMSLGGHISSANVVKNLVDVQAFDGGQFLRVVPGYPEQSWLFLKASGLAAEAGCEGSTCNAQSMPPGATPDRRLTETELSALEQWILDGAPGPT